MVSEDASAIRVAGLGVWLPGARGPDEVWARITNGTAAFGPLPSLRCDPQVLKDELPPDHPGCELGATLGEVDVDWRKLRLPPLSVARMHTMEKVALAVMADALTDAGFEPRRTRDTNVRVYIAATTLAPDPRTDHGRRIRRHELAAPVSDALAASIPERAAEVSEYVDRLFDLVAPPVEPDSMMSSASILAGRICNLYDFRGGHLAIDASMVASMAAIETAAADLRSGLCDVALVCAVSPLLTASGLLAMAAHGALSPSPPRPFSRNASGTFLGEGAVAVVLDRGSEAPRARARGWLESIASASQVVDLPGTAKAVASAAGRALGGRDPTRVAFVSTRAAGIPSIDLEEASALAEVYGAPTRSAALPLACSVPLFGHLGGAAGMLALAHGLLALEAGRLHAPSVADSNLTKGLIVGANDVEIAPDARAAISDVGLAPLAYHAIVAGPDAFDGTPTVLVRRSDGQERLAITGMGVVVPGASDVATFWHNVLSCVDSITDLPASRWDVERFIDASEELGAILKTRLAAPVQLPSLASGRHRLPPRAAAEIDPAVILSLDTAEQALREAGGADVWPSDRVAVVSGQLSLRWAEAQLEKRVLFSGHLSLVREAMREAGFEEAVVEAVARGARQRFDAANPHSWADALAARTGLDCAAHVARAWSFEGPLLSVDAACASSLAAVERATRKLLAHEVDAAVTIGVAYNLLPEYYVVLSILGALSPRGAPPFHVGADGFVPGEGAAAIILERLSDAERRGARIHAILHANGCSSDGAGVSIFAPNGEGEKLAIARAFDASPFAPVEVDLVEAHGTGTKLGDETEVRAYQGIYGERDPTMPLSIGTVKSQIGHLSSAAGMVGLIKAALAVRDGILPPSLGEEPTAGLTRGAVRLSGDARPWAARPRRKRRAGVSAFGLGGINYHTLLEEPPCAESERAPFRSPQAQRPATSPFADRFEPELVPSSLADRAPRHPLAGRSVWIIPDRGALWQTLGAAIEARGGRVTVLDAGVALERATPADGIVDLSAFGRGPGDPLSPEVDERAIERVTFALRAMGVCYERMQSAPPGRSFYVAVTSLGGDFGLSGCDGGDLTGAALLGLAKGIKQELPTTLSRGIDFGVDEPDDAVADFVLRELEDGNDQLEVAWAGRRLVTRLRRLPLRDEAPIRPVREEDVILISGGGRGVVFECATALARLGARVIVCGRTPVPRAGEPHLDLDADAFVTWGRQRMLERRQQDPSASPRVLRAEIESLRRERELWANLRRSAHEGLPLSYVCCDVEDAEAVRRVVDGVRSQHGPITGLAHGAMVQWSTLASRKEPDKIARTLAVKSKGLANLLTATLGDPLEVVLCFGSGAGRFGNRGQADYCAANALMAARLAAAKRADSRSTRFVTVDWTAWDSVGAAVEDPDLAELLRTTGITSISLEEGTYWFLREWTAGTSSEVVVLEERMLHDWPFLGRQAEHDVRGPTEIDDLGRPFVGGAWPLIDRVLERRRGRVVVERRFEVESDAFLDQHRLHGVPILPATFGCELLAEVAALCLPGSEIAAVYDLRIETPAKLFREAPLVLRATAELEDGGHDGPIIRAESRSRLVLRGRELTERIHHSARFVLRPRGSVDPRPLAIEELEGTARARSFFHMARDPVTLGPLYSRGRWIQVRDQTVVGSIRAPRQRDAMQRTTWPIFQVDPLIMDTAFQIAANWDGFGEGHVSIPYGMAELQLGRGRRRGEGARVRAVVTRVEDPDVYYDIDVAADDGQMLMQIRGLHLRRISPRDGPT